MSNSIVPSSIKALAGARANIAQTVGEIGSGDAYGQFTKIGEWTFGQEKIEVEEGSQWAVNPLQVRHGWIHWPDSGRPTEILVPITEAAPQQHQLPELDGPWNAAMSFQARCLNGEDEGQQVIFKGSSIGFTRAASKLAQEIAARAAEGHNDVMPIVELDRDSYQHKSYGKIFTPVLKVAKWVDLEGEAEEKAEEVEEKAEPTRRRRRKA